ncbi:Gmad2 immunoglobulin-like domain-containing protein [Paractinoplanes hotanensis]|uniref:GerMN domain-containing protein n=1 Tax=Paractinoplanes hotanensis TaxID=2906497 RepID=A0ABT0YED6_9ACTN|nr:Gmad2 immunoglobulin-like domain-containing protein [Actinoplanes hotanensis]MCM4084415.1 GerMN domain-containing protein [Actinoplanes hotanensis]
MLYRTGHRQVAIIAGAFLAMLLALGGVWLVTRSSGSGDTTATPVAPPASSDTGPSGRSSSPSAPKPATMTVTVYFHRGQNTDPTKVVAVQRTVPKSAKVGTASLKQLLAGPTEVERSSGYWSFFSAKTAGTLRTLRIGDGVARADFRDLRAIIPNASSSHGSAALLAELDHTLKQFRSVRSTVYSLDGDVAAFYEWLQLEPPEATMPGLAEARRVAGDFLHDVVAMPEPVYVAARWRSDFIATVDFRSRIDGVNPTRGPVTTVTLGRGRTTFTVLGATTSTIRMDTPAEAITPSDLAVVTSPTRISGSALAFEGAIAVRVLQASGGTVQQLGSGSVLGGGDVMRPFSGSVEFRRPNAGFGWVIAFERSAVNGAVVKATAVRVAFRAVSS